MTTPTSPRRIGRGLIGALTCLLLGTVACASEQAATAAKPSQIAQNRAQACNAARPIVQQVLQLRTDQITAAQYDQALALSGQLRALANATQDDVIKERLEYDADAAQALAAAVRAGDVAAAAGAQGVLAGFERACPLTNLP